MPALMPAILLRMYHASQRKDMQAVSDINSPAAAANT